MTNIIEYYKDCELEDGGIDLITEINPAGTHKFYVKLTTNVFNNDNLAFDDNEKLAISNYINSHFYKPAITSLWYAYPIVFKIANGKTKLNPLFFIKIDYNDPLNPLIDFSEEVRVNLDAWKHIGKSLEEFKTFAQEIKLYEGLSTVDFFKNINIFMSINYPDLLYNQKIDKGIYFKAIITNSEKSKFTVGLLGELESIKNSKLSNSVLSKFLCDKKLPSYEFKGTLYDIFNLNEKQSDAVESAFNNHITLIEGPPGTGKSQVVASIIANAFLNGEKVLFSSKVNKAVDVVEDKLNSLHENYKFLIRLGRGEENKFVINLKKYLNYLLANVLDDNKIQEIQTDIEKLKAQLIRLTKDKIEIKNQIDKYSASRDKITKIIKKNNFEDKKKEILIKKIKYSILNKNIKKSFLINKEIKSISSYVNALETLHKVNFEDLIIKLDSVGRYIENISKELFLKTYELNLFSISKIELIRFQNLITDLGSIIKGAKPLKGYHVLYNRIKSNIKLLSPKLLTFSVSNLSIYNFFPFLEGVIDLLIIDEASQNDIASVLPLLYRAKRVVVLGDSHQLKHITSISQSLSSTLISEHKIEPRYDYVQNSFLDITKPLADKTIFLNEHFRSHADIIGFPNGHPGLYGGKLTVSTIYGTLNPKIKLGEFAIDWIDVKGVIKQKNGVGAYIDEEIEKILLILHKLILQDNYHGTIGVVSPFREQANKIQKKIKYDVLLKPYLDSQIMCDTIYGFQGDEKDIMIFSIVIAENMPSGVKFYHKETINLLNVALTRAKAKLIVVGNFDACKKCGIPHYKAFSKYYDDLKEGKIITNEIKPTKSQSESGYEELLKQALDKEKIEYIQQYNLGQYRLDFAIQTDKVKLDVEVDGMAHHTTWSGERLKKDLVRNQRIENLEWKVLRLWSYELRDDMDYCIKRIKEMLT